LSVRGTPDEDSFGCLGVFCCVPDTAETDFGIPALAGIPTKKPFLAEGLSKQRRGTDSKWWAMVETHH